MHYQGNRVDNVIPDTELITLEKKVSQPLEIVSRAMAASIGEIALLPQLLQLSHVRICSGTGFSAETGDQDCARGSKCPVNIMVGHRSR
jgi:hypothetical protein